MADPSSDRPPPSYDQGAAGISSARPRRAVTLVPERVEDQLATDRSGSSAARHRGRWLRSLPSPRGGAGCPPRSCTGEPLPGRRLTLARSLHQRSADRSSISVPASCPTRSTHETDPQDSPRLDPDQRDQHSPAPVLNPAADYGDRQHAILASVLRQLAPVTSRHAQGAEIEGRIKSMSSVPTRWSDSVSAHGACSISSGFASSCLMWRHATRCLVAFSTGSSRSANSSMTTSSTRSRTDTDRFT